MKFDYQRNLKLYYFFEFFATLSFFVPIITIFFLELGLTMTQIYILESFYALSIILLEVPTGAIADHLGCKRSMIYGTIGIAAGALFMGLGQSFNQLLIAEFLWALGFSLTSGADSAFVYNSLVAVNKEKDFKKVSGNAYLYRMIGAGTASFLGGLMAAYSLRIPVLLTAIGAMIAGLLLTRAIEPPRKQKVEIGYWQRVIQSFKFVYKHKLIRWLSAYMSFLVAGGVILFWVYQPYFEISKIPIIYFGIIFTMLQAVSGLSAKFSHQFEKLLGNKGSLIALGVMFAIPFFFMTRWTPIWGFLVIFLHQSVRGLTKPVIQHQILEYTWEDKRATVLSISSLVSRLGFVILAPIFGKIVDLKGLQPTLGYTGYFVLGVLVIALIGYWIIPSKYFKIKKSP